MRYHASCLGLIVVLEEANVAARMSMGLALHSWIASCKIWPQENMDDMLRRHCMKLSSWRRPSEKIRLSFCPGGWQKRSGGQRLSDSRRS